MRITFVPTKFIVGTNFLAQKEGRLKRVINVDSNSPKESRSVLQL
jgi:hypothetical protein